MIKTENVEVVGLEAAIRGMRNPMNSWEKGDSGYCSAYIKNSEIQHIGCSNCYRDSLCHVEDHINKETYQVGVKDHELMMTLRNAGTDHRKFMRMIVVYVDITAPLYWWSEFDTYKVGTVANSCSTMHKIHEKVFTSSDFSDEHLISVPVKDAKAPAELLDAIIYSLNNYREVYLETKDKKYWWQMIQILPRSYNQKRTVMLNYEVLANVYKKASRRYHKLDEWCVHEGDEITGFCDWIKTLPYHELITGSINE